jgi:RimJ/RimL family protein N-acetyltransferase
VPDAEEDLDPSQLPIKTRSLLIRQFVQDDAGALLALSHEDTLRTWLPNQVYADAAHAASVLEFLIGAYSTPADPRYGPYVLAIEQRIDRALIGHVGFSPVDGDVEIGFAIGQTYQRRGFATEAIVAACRWAIDVFTLQKIVGITSVANTASRRALLRAKFEHEGERVMRFQGTDQTVSMYTLSGHSGPMVGA